MQGVVQLGRRTDCTAPRIGAGQAGFSLIEVVIAVALVSLSVLSLAMGFLTLMRANAATAAQQEADHAAANFSESLKAAGYQPCAPGSTPDYDADAALWSPPSGVQVRVVHVEYWSPASRAYVDSCPSGDTGTQRVTVRAEFRDRERTAQIVKRNR